MSSSLKPLQSTLEAILSRLSILESNAGIQSGVGNAHASSVAAVDVDEAAPSLVAYDEHISSTLKPFVEACNSIEGLKDTGSNIQKIWDGIRVIIEIGTKCKKPSDVQSSLMPHLKPVQDAMGDIRKARLDRKFDWHIKAIMEMLACVSWVIMSSPPAPSSFIKDTVGSSDFWSNKIRKEYKGKDEKMISFCDTLKALILDLSSYVKEYHLSGLMWNPKGIPIQDFKASSTDTATKTEEKTQTKQAPTGNISGASSADIMKELAAKRTGDGSSAATGLKKVTRDQQTWRKEFKKSTPNSAPVPSAVKPSQVKKSSQKITAATPVCKFQNLGSKWIIEHQTKTSNPNGLCTVEIKNPKEQAYIYKCDGATIQIKGKLKSVILDSCTKTNLVFESAISSCEVVNCKRVQIQATGVCPSFSIDKTDGCITYLSEEAVSVTNFVTSKSTEMNVSWTDAKSGEQKEAPIPEQFVHRLKDGAVTSEVSDLYH